MIKLINSPTGKPVYVMDVTLARFWATQSDDRVYDALHELATMWVSEHEGYNSIEFDCMVEDIEEQLSYQVLVAREHSRDEVEA